MRAALALLLALSLPLPAYAAPKLARPSVGGSLSKKFPGKKPPPAVQVLFAAALTGNCDGAVPTASTGQTLSFTRAGTATYIKNDGTLVTLTANQPRTNQYGLLMEAAATNVLTWSNALDNAFWNKSNASVTADTTVGPDGLTTLDTVTSTTTAGSVFRVASIASQVGPFTASAWSAATSGTHAASILVGCTGGVASACSCARSDGAACTPSTSTVYCIATPSVGTSPVRVSVTATCSVALTNPTLTIMGGTYAVSTGAHAWGKVQFETGSYASSYIENTSTSASRTAEPGLSGSVPLPTGEGCMAATVRSLALAPASGARLLNWASTDSLNLGSNTVLNFATATAGGDPTLTVSSLQGRSTRVVADWSSGDNFNRLTNDAAINSTSYVAMGAASTLYIGANAGGTNPTQGYVSDVRVTNRPGACP